MPVIQLPATVLRLGAPVPFALRDASGHLLVARGATVDSADRLAQLVLRGIYVDEADSQVFRRAMAAKVDSMMRSNARLGDIAQAVPEAPPTAPADLSMLTARKRPGDPITALNGMLMRTSSVLHEPGADFADRVATLDNELLELINGDADGTLLMLMHTSTSETHKYSVSHALLVTAVCELAARHIASWPAEHRVSMRRAALTMNVAMTELQNQLVHQDAPLSLRQREVIDGHAVKGAALMRRIGVSDELWLQAVENHHASPPGPLAELPTVMQLSRLIQRADIFAARLSPRQLRQAMSASAAAKAAYLDENKQADEAGAAIVKGLGIHPPGSFVRLANTEVAVVLRRGRRANEPLVASVLSKSGTPMGVPALRDTRLKGYEIAAGVAPHEVKLRLNLASLLQLA